VNTITETDALPDSLTREALYDLVWSEPMIKVAAKCGVSGSYLARVCGRMNVPRSERGYWAKLAVGKAQTQVPLPEAQPGDELVWSRDGTHIYVTPALPKPPGRMRRKRLIAPAAASEHPLVAGVKANFEAGGLSREAGYLKPAKRLLVDLVVTKTGLDRALAFANQLFLTLEANSHRVMLSPKGQHFQREDVDERETPSKTKRFNNLWSPYRETVVYIGTVAIGLTIIELSEEVEVRYVKGEYVRERDYVPPKRNRYAFDHTWTTKKDLPTGRLCLQAYSPYHRAKWVTQWREKAPGDLDDKIKGIVKALEAATEGIARGVEEGARQAEIERREWEIQWANLKREQEERRIAEAIKASRQDLVEIIDRWAEVSRIAQFFSEAERRAADLGDEERLKLLERLRLARELIGSIDALEHFMAWRSPEER
jgi:hypothetical protein